MSKLPDKILKQRKQTVELVDKVVDSAGTHHFRHLTISIEKDGKSYKKSILSEKYAFLYVLRRNKKYTGFNYQNEKSAYNQYRIFKSRYF